MHLKGCDAWKTRSDLDDALRWRCDHRERCFMCDAPLPEGSSPWSFWRPDGVVAALCDECAPEGEPDAR